MLVIDDDEVDRLTLVRALKKSGIEFELSETGDPSNQSESIQERSARAQQDRQLV